MKNNFNIIDKPLLVNEAGVLLYFYTCWLKSTNKNLISFKDSYPGYKFTQTRLLSDLESDHDFDKSYIDFMKTVKSEAQPYLEDFFDDKNEDIYSLFHSYNNNDENYFSFLASIFQNINARDFKDFSYEGFKEIFDLFFARLIGIDFDDEAYKEIKSYEDLKSYLGKTDILAYIAELSYDDSKIMTLVRSYKNTRGLYDRLYPLIKKLCEIISKNFHIIEELFLDNIARMKEDSYKRVWKVIEQTGLIEDFEKRTLPLDLYTLIVSPKTIMIQWFSHESDESFIKFGLFSDQKKSESSNKLATLSQDLKILGDTTRIEILDILKDKSYYAKELSDMLFISPATLSYHLKQLQIKGFVGLRTEGRRFYYFLRKTGFKEVIRVLEEFTKNIKEE